MSIHISAPEGSIAKTVLMPGDPLRAQYIAEHFLQNVTKVSQTRNIFFFTGIYKGEQVTVGASGMGCPSIGIYSYELYSEYDVDCIIRIGTCGAYSSELHLFDLINVEAAASESTFARYSWGIEGELIPHQGMAYAVINETAKQLNTPIVNSVIHSSDIFYRKDSGIPKVAKDHHCMAVEMESFALFANAKHLHKTAAAILTVSDVIPTQEKISADERERALKPMIELALEACLNLK